MDDIVHTVLTAIISSAILSTIVGLMFQRRNAKIVEEIKSQFERSSLEFRSGRAWKERSISDLLGRLYLQFDRTGRAFQRYESHNLYLEAKILKDGNTAIRDMLIQQAHLIPPLLLEDAGKLLKHYDRWLEEFERVRSEHSPDLNTPFVFVGTKGFPFPRQSELKFRQAFRDLWEELYGIEVRQTDSRT